MTTHLEEREFVAAVESLELEPETADHLAVCISCRQQVAALREAIAGRREEILGRTPNWDRQREEVLARLTTAPATLPKTPRRWARPLLAVAAVLLVAVGLNFLWHPANPIEPPTASELQIEQILAEVDAVLADDGLPGFESIDPGTDDLESFLENGVS